MTDLDQTACDALATELISTGAHALAWELDVSSEQAWVDAAAQTVSALGGIQVLVNNAGAKGAVRLMTKTAALHWGTAGVRVNSIHPGFVETDRSRSLMAGTPQLTARIEGTPLGRLGRVDEVAAAIAFLASEDSSFMTG
jgi:NAD(P)-dependent dehydrogenase (short-subunit alcohol dehydrogenase family)